MKRNLLLLFIIALLGLISSIVFSLPLLVRGIVIGVCIICITFTILIYTFYKKLH